MNPLVGDDGLPLMTADGLAAVAECPDCCGPGTYVPAVVCGSYTRPAAGVFIDAPAAGLPLDGVCRSARFQFPYNLGCVIAKGPPTASPPAGALIINRLPADGWDATRIDCCSCETTCGSRPSVVPATTCNNNGVLVPDQPGYTLSCCQFNSTNSDYTLDTKLTRSTRTIRFVNITGRGAVMQIITYSSVETRRLVTLSSGVVQRETVRTEESQLTQDGQVLQGPSTYSRTTTSLDDINYSGLFGAGLLDVLLAPWRCVNQPGIALVTTYTRSCSCLSASASGTYRNSLGAPDEYDNRDYTGSVTVADRGVPVGCAGRCVNGLGAPAVAGPPSTFEDLL